MIKVWHGDLKYYAQFLYRLCHYWNSRCSMTFIIIFKYVLWYLPRIFIIIRSNYSNNMSLKLIVINSAICNRYDKSKWRYFDDKFWVSNGSEYTEKCVSEGPYAGCRPIAGETLPQTSILVTYFLRPTISTPHLYDLPVYKYYCFYFDLIIIF